MTIRSVVLGLCGAAGICSITYFNNRILNGTQLIGNNLPVAIYGILIIGVLAINPLLKKFAFTGKEIAVALALTLAACTIPGSGLLHTFPGVLVLPHHQQQKQAGWQGNPTVVDAGHVKNWASLRSALSVGPLADKLPETFRRQLGKPGSLSDAERSALLVRLNDLIHERTLLEPSISDLELPRHVQHLVGRDYAELTQLHAEYLGRAVLDAYLADHLESRRPSVVEHAPSQMLADVSEDERVLNGFVLGLARDRSISPADIPWHAWWRTLLFWIPMLLTMWGALVALSLVVHRQWSQHEHLPYPITTFADSLLPQEGGGTAAVFRSKSFWWAMGLVLLLYINNYAAQVFPEHLVSVSTRLNFRPLAKLFPTFVLGGGDRWPSLLAPKVYFIAISIAFFIPKDVSFSLGIGPFLWALLAGFLALYGVSMSTPLEASAVEWMGVTLRAFVIFGAVMGVFVSIVYTGRQYYKAVVLTSLRMKTIESVSPAEAWAGRSFMFLTALLIMQIAVLARAGLVAAVFYVIVMFIAALVTARIIAETGLFHIQIMLFPCAIIWGLLGLSGLGTRTLLILQLVTMVMLIDPRESLMPFMANSLKLLERRSVALDKPVLYCVAALTIGLGVGLPTTMYLQYNRGLAGSGWAETFVPAIPFRNAMSAQRRMEARGVEGGLDAKAGVRISQISPQKTCLTFMLISMGVVLLTMVARLRWRWWPIHPLLFVIWSSGHMRYFAGAFLLGWIIKVAVTKYGGSTVYEELKPLMIGLMAGEIFGAVIPCILSLLCWLVTGEAPQRFDVLPN